MSNFLNSDWYKTATPWKVMLTAATQRNINSSDNVMGETPAMHAARAVANPGIITTMTKMGANLSIRNLSGMTALSIAVVHNPIADIINELINCGAEVNSRDGAAAMTPLMHACQSVAEPIIVDRLIMSGARCNVHSRDRRMLALHYAAINHTDPVIIDLLVAAPGGAAQLNNFTEDGHTALMLACAHNPNPTVAAALIANQAEMVLGDKEGQSALDYLKDNNKAKEFDETTYQLVTTVLENHIAGKDIPVYVEPKILEEDEEENEGAERTASATSAAPEEKTTEKMEQAQDALAAAQAAMGITRDTVEHQDSNADATAAPVASPQLKSGNHAQEAQEPAAPSSAQAAPAANSSGGTLKLELPKSEPEPAASESAPAPAAAESESPAAPPPAPAAADKQPEAKKLPLPKFKKPTVAKK